MVYWNPVEQVSSPHTLGSNGFVGLACINENHSKKGVSLVTFPVTIVNLVLTSIIAVLGIWAFFKRKADIALTKPGISAASALDKTTARARAIPSVSLFIGVAFALFAVSHALTLAGLAKSLEAFIISIRTIGYLLVVVAPARILLKK
jgi:hypothetical protein